MIVQPHWLPALVIALLCGYRPIYAKRLAINIVAHQGGATDVNVFDTFRAKDPLSLTEYATDHSHIDWAPAGIKNPSEPLLVTLLPLRLIFPTLTIFGPRSSLFFSSPRCH
jgi:hypothetical protein